ncbi:MAG TPA: GNAT family N-acetyltransferase [Gemmatimonadaceae bacterium]|nr:GNAT family N-acetyltransferase [Gemmatimonadaceae bacterium]
MLAPALKRLAVHAAREEDLAAALALVKREKERNRWIERTADVLRSAVAEPEGEYRACVAERDGELVALGAYGIVAGTIGTGMIYSILVAPRSRRAGIGERLLFQIKTDLAAAGARIVVAEIPGDPTVMRFRALLLTHGFREEARIEDYYADGIPQIISLCDL